MERPSDMDLVEVARLAHQSRIKLALTSLSAAVVIFAVTALLPRRYAYVALMRTAAIDVPDTETRTSYLAQVILGRKNSPPILKSQGVQYLQFKFVDAPRGGLLSREPYVKSVDNYPNNDLFSITVHAISLDEAKSHTEHVMEDLIAQFAPKIEAARLEMKERIDLLARKIDGLNAAIRGFSESSASVPNKSDYPAYRLEAEADLVSAELELASLKAASAPGRLRNFRIMDHHPKALSPVFPRPLLFSVLGALAAASVFLTGLVLSEQRRRRIGELPGVS